MHCIQLVIVFLQVSSISAQGATSAKRDASRTPQRLDNISTPPSAREVLGKISGVALDMDDRGTTPERVEFENSLQEQGSDEEEYLSEDEWTDRNFGASANELDDTSNESDEYSDRCVLPGYMFKN